MKIDKKSRELYLNRGWTFIELVQAKDKQSLAQVAGVLSEKPNVGITALNV